SARSAASTIFGGVGKSGSPISRWMMLRPCASSLRALASTSNAVSVPISSIRRANFMCRLSSHAERTEVARIGQPGHSDVLHAGQTWSVPELVEKVFQYGRAALGLNLHRAIVAIANVALKSQLTGVAL